VEIVFLRLSVSDNYLLLLCYKSEHGAIGVALCGVAIDRADLFEWLDFFLRYLCDYNNRNNIHGLK
jgi:hypothetical protein